MALDWFSWASQHSDCQMIFKVSDDVYVRVIPLVNYFYSISSFTTGALRNISEDIAVVEYRSAFP